MTARPRCSRGHFLPVTGDCRCEQPRPRWQADLWGQGLTALQRFTIRTVQITGRYL